ncbi:MAG: DUF2934 domain-containing protein [Ferrovum myxofaciens]
MEKTEKLELSGKSVKSGKITTKTVAEKTPAAKTSTTKAVAAKTPRAKTLKTEKSSEPVVQIPSVSREESVATAAYFLAEKRGFVSGFELQDWFEAEYSVKGEGV